MAIGVLVPVPGEEGRGIRGDVQVVVNVDVQAISGTGAVLTLIAEDASGRTFTPITLSGNTKTATGVFRIVITDFAAFLRLGLTLSANQVVGRATATVEYTLKNA